MAKLLINEHPLQVLPTLATWIGLNEAIFLQQLHYWLNNPKVGKCKDGRKWIRNSVGEWLTDNFPFWDERTFRRITANLRDDGLIDTRSDLNKMGPDRTLWYTLNYGRLDALTGQVERIKTKRRRRKKAIGQIDRMGAIGQIDRMEPDKLTGPITRDYTETTHDDDNGNDLLGTDFQKAMDFYQTNINLSESPIIYQEMSSDPYASLPFDWWREAIEIAAGNNVRRWSYIRAVLDRSIRAGVSPRRCKPEWKNGRSNQRTNSAGKQAIDEPAEGSWIASLETKDG